MNRTHLTLGDTGRPKDRVIRIVNLHYEADGNDVRDFFGDGSTVIDFMRGVNTKTNRNTVGYVPLATEQERIDAQALSGNKILDHEVKVIPAQTGFRISASGDKLLPPLKDKQAQALGVADVRDEAPPAVGDVEAFPPLGMAATPRLAATPARTSVALDCLETLKSSTMDEQGFLPTANENVAIFSTFPRDSVAYGTSLISSSTGLGTGEDLRLTAPSGSSSTANDNSTDFHHLLGKLQMTDKGGQQRAQRAAFDRTADERRPKNAEAVWGMSRTHMGAHHQAQQQTLRPMSSGIEGPGPVVEGPTFTPHQFFSPLARAPSTVPRGPPLGINTDYRPREYGWALPSGNENPAHQVIREDEWHGGPRAIQQRQQELKPAAEIDNAQRIIAKAGISEDDKDKGNGRK